MTKKKKDARRKGPPSADAGVNQPSETGSLTDAPAKAAEQPQPALPQPPAVVEIADSSTPAPPAENARAADGEGSPATMESAQADTQTRAPFPIVGIGASAGGLAAFEAFFAHMPSDSEPEVSFVIVQHLDPDHKSILTELVRRYARMRVVEVVDGMQVEPNCTYIITPNKDMVLKEGRLYLREPEARRGMRLPIDIFFRSLAQERGEHSIGIILSGNGTDGTLGLRAIKEAGGMALVQDPLSADYDGMPRSAISSGLADYVLSPEDMPAELLAYVKRSLPLKEATRKFPDISAWLLKIMALLRAHTGHDFSHYKQNTIRRRVERRMAVNQIESISDYSHFLRQTPTELDTLFRELLIGVTDFFRDLSAFEAVRDLALPAILSERPQGQAIRVWVPGCSTGEEAYSLAMLLNQAMEKLGRDFPVQIFATDIDHESIEKARNAVYPASIAGDVSPEQLSRYFTQEEKDFYRVKKTVRDQLIFAEQDVIKDPPFSKLDLISCRNMLIYMEPILQKRLIPLFHYALAPGGFLLLGNSESVGEFTNLFHPVERRWKLYRRKDLIPGLTGGFAMPNLLPAGDRPQPGLQHEVKEKKLSLREVTERVLLRNYAPACVTVNEQGEILYIHGRSGRYMELPPGEVSLNLVRAAREGLKIELANGLRAVVARRQPMHYHGLDVRVNGGYAKVDVTIELAEGPASASNIMIVTFRENESPVPLHPPKVSRDGKPETPDTAPADEKDRHIAALERELRLKSETLQTAIEELETSNEELKSTNEELQSTNEELQSTNEELETSKEELQSVNEELVTVNTELNQKMEGLARANNDMNNLLAGTGIGMLFVDHQLHIQRFTPATTQIINLIQTDIGRPVSDLVSNLQGYDRFGQDIQAVLDSLIPRETEVQTRDGHWYQMRILPYRTLDNVIEGAVVTFVDIGVQKRAEEQHRKLSEQLEQKVRERVSELELVSSNLSRETTQRQIAEARRAADAAALSRLSDMAEQMNPEDPSQKLLHASMDAAIELTGADKGMLQLFNADSKELRLVAHRGFAPEVVEQFATVTAGTGTPCGEAMRQKKRVVVEDVLQTTFPQGTPVLAALEAAGVRAIQATPVLARDGRLLGVYSTHWSHPFRPDEGTLRFLDLLARQLADLIESHNVIG